MATEYSPSYGLGNLTIMAPWFDSNKLRVNKRDRVADIHFPIASTSEVNLRIPDTDSSGGFVCACMELKLH